MVALVFGVALNLVVLLGALLVGAEQEIPSVFEFYFMFHVSPLVLWVKVFRNNAALVELPRTVDKTPYLAIIALNASL